MKTRTWTVPDLGFDQSYATPVVSMYGVKSQYTAKSSVDFTTPAGKEAFLRSWDTYRTVSEQFAPVYMTTSERFDSTKRRRGIPNDCLHDLMRQLNYGFTSASYVEGGSGRWYTRTENHFRARYSLAKPAQPKMRWDLVDDNLRAEAYWTMRPRFEGEISMINSLFELKDFKDMVKFLSPKRIRQVTDNLLMWNPKKNKGVPVPSVCPTKQAAQVYLFNQFALQPLIKDVSLVIAQAQARFFDLMKEFKLTGEEGNTRYFTRDLLPVTSLAFKLADSVRTEYEGSVSSAKFTGVMSYNYDYRPQAAWREFQKYWGLGITPKAVWNFLPFSFLVDYIFTIDKSLTAMQADPNLDLFVKHYTESMLCSIRQGRFIGPGTDPNNVGCLLHGKAGLSYSSPTSVKPQFVAGYLGETFHRILTEPYRGPALPRIKMPSTQQARNLLALARCFI